MSYLAKQRILAADSPSIDAFSRWRVSQPQGVFDCQLTYDLAPLIFEQLTANGGGGTAAVAHDATNRCATMTFTSAQTGGYSYMQSYEYVRYQPGKSQQAFITFNFISAAANVLKFAGYSDGVNGIEFQLNGSTCQFTLYSDTTTGDETVTQANWNIDKFDGTGSSGLTLDPTKMQILVIDFQALYAGRVRVGFDIGGVVTYAHELLHANIDATPYIQNASLPIRCGMSCTGTVSTTMRFICSSVISEGGQEEANSYPLTVKGAATAASGARTHALSLRPLTTFNSIANRSKFVLDSVEVVVTGASPVYWEMVIGQAISGTTAFTAVNAAYSAFEFNTAGTISGDPAMVLSSGFVAASNQARGSGAKSVSTRIPISLGQAGAVRANGTLSLIAQGLGGASAMQAAFNWREIR